MLFKVVVFGVCWECDWFDCDGLRLFVEEKSIKSGWAVVVSDVVVFEKQRDAEFVVVKLVAVGDEVL